MLDIGGSWWDGWLMGYEAKLGHGPEGSLPKVVAVATVLPGGVVETVIVRKGRC